MKKNLHFFTSSFPYNNTPEGAFIVPELHYTSQEFDHIYIYTLKKTGNITFKLPTNVSVVNFDFDYCKTISFKIKLKLIRIVLSELIHNKTFRKLSTFKFLYSQLKQYYIKGMNILPKLKKNVRQNDLLYTFWFAEWNYILSLLKNENKLQNVLISKAHGFDLYNERNSLGLIPFRRLQLKHTQKIFSISSQGQNYLSNIYNKNKFETAKLATFNHGLNPRNLNAEEIILVSCSSISNVKRVHLIPTLLKNVTIPLRWIHFGSGTNLDHIKKLIPQLPKNITVELRGHVNNHKVLEFYKFNHVDLFINVSSSEGIPVSIMEAISFGIPIIAFDVGGISEIVTDKTGFLVSDKNNTNSISTYINHFKKSKYQTDEFREGVVKFWVKEFSASINHTKFSQKIKKM